MSTLKGVLIGVMIRFQFLSIPTLQVEGFIFISSKGLVGSYEV